MKRSAVIPYVSFLVDNALSARKCDSSEVLPTDTLVGWQCGFEPLFVAVRSYLGDTDGNLDIVDESDAEEIAREYLEEIKWFSDESRDADYVILGVRK